MTGTISCVAEISRSGLSIEAVTRCRGIMGSMKTAQVINMISTSVMVGTGEVYQKIWLIMREPAIICSGQKYDSVQQELMKKSRELYTEERGGHNVHSLWKYGVDRILQAITNGDGLSGGTMLWARPF